MRILLICLLWTLFTSDVHNARIVATLWKTPGVAVFDRDPLNLDSTNSRISEFSEIEREGSSRLDNDETESSTVETTKPVAVTSSSSEDVEVETIAPGPRPSFGSSFWDALFPKPFLTPLNPNQFFWQFTKPWWMKNNVCINKEVIEESQKDLDGNETSVFIPFNISTKRCYERDDAYTCTTKLITPTENRTTVSTYHCCIGYRLDTEQGLCVMDVVKDINETLNTLGCGKMAELLEEASKRTSFTNITIFAPTDGSLIDYEDLTNKKMNEIPVMTDSAPNDDTLFDMINNHVVNGLQKMSSMRDDMLLRTVGNSSVRINVYGGRRSPTIRTANCVPIVSSDIHAKDAIIHVTAGVLQHPTQSVMDMLSADSRFTTFVSLLKKANLTDMLADRDSSYTIIAPTNKAFESIDPNLLESYRNGKACVDQVVRNHIIESYVCSAAASSSSWYRSMLKQRIFFSKKDNMVFINDIPVTETEKLGTNGVIYGLSNVLIPESAKPLSELLPHTSISDFLKFSNETSLLSQLDGNSNYSVFIPLDPFNNTGMESSEFLNMYVVPSFIDNHRDSRILTTLNGSKIRYTNFSPFPGLNDLLSASLVQCSQVIDGPIHGCGADAYIISNPLKTVSSNLLKTIADDPNLGIFYSILNKSSVASMLDEESGPFTVLAPTDEAINEYLKESTLDRIRESDEESDRFVRRHILTQNACCATMIFAHRALDHSLLFGRSVMMPILGSADSDDSHGRVEITSQSSRITSSITKCDNLATNGVMHVINRPLYGGRSNISRMPVFIRF